MSWQFIKVLDMDVPTNTEYERYLARKLIEHLANPNPFCISDFKFRSAVYELPEEPNPREYCWNDYQIFEGTAKVVGEFCLSSVEYSWSVEAPPTSLLN